MPFLTSDYGLIREIRVIRGSDLGIRDESTCLHRKRRKSVYADLGINKFTTLTFYQRISPSILNGFHANKNLEIVRRNDLFFIPEIHISEICDHVHSFIILLKL